MFGNVWDVNGRFRQPFCFRQGKDLTSSLALEKEKKSTLYQRLAKNLL